jgi:hypothetical protein
MAPSRASGETGLFGRIGTTTSAGQDGEQVKLEDFLSNQIEGMIADTSVM